VHGECLPNGQEERESGIRGKDGSTAKRRCYISSEQDTDKCSDSSEPTVPSTERRRVPAVSAYLVDCHVADA